MTRKKKSDDGRPLAVFLGFACGLCILLLSGLLIKEALFEGRNWKDFSWWGFMLLTGLGLLNLYLSIFIYNARS